MQSSAGVGANLPDAEAYASAAGFDFGAGCNSSLEAPRPLLRGGSFSRGFALPMHGPGTLSTLHPELPAHSLCSPSQSNHARAVCSASYMLNSLHQPALALPRM